MKWQSENEENKKQKEEINRLKELKNEQESVYLRLVKKIKELNASIEQQTKR